MGHTHEWCGSCGLVFSRRLIDRVGLADLVLVSGARADSLRCAAQMGKLMVLAPESCHAARDVVEQDEVVGSFSVVDPQEPSVAITLLGWVTIVPPAEITDAASAFAETHPTEDLFEIGSDWQLLQVDVAEARLHWSGHSMVLSAEQLEVALSLVRC